MKDVLNTKAIFIADYLDEKMKDCKLPYGMKYLNLVAKHTEDAEKKWKQKKRKK